jgi:hypothetical protein
MDTPAEMLKQYANEIGGHRKWLRSFDEGYASKWEKLLKADPEAAICEAATRELLQQHNVTVEPNEDLSLGGPDFLCTRSNNKFYVEVTCISKQAATESTGLIDHPLGTFSDDDWAYEDMTKRIFNEVRKKTSQGVGLDKPYIVAVCTLHLSAGHVCFDEYGAEELLTATPCYTALIDKETGKFEEEPYEKTNLSNSVFIRFSRSSTNEIEYARNPISAVILCGFVCYTTQVVGILHPNPNNVFDRDFLPCIKFAKLADRCLDTCKLKVEWV